MKREKESDGNDHSVHALKPTVNLYQAMQTQRRATRRVEISSLILSTATRYLLPLMLLFSLFLLLRGHNEPGGGFVGGLVTAAAFALHAIAYGVERARRVLRVDPRILIAVGLLMAAGSGLFSLVNGEPFLTGLWGVREVPVLGKVGTPLLFDTGVYLVVVGTTLTILFSLAEE